MPPKISFLSRTCSESSHCDSFVMTMKGSVGGLSMVALMAMPFIVVSWTCTPNLSATGDLREPWLNFKGKCAVRVVESRFCSSFSIGFGCAPLPVWCTSFNIEHLTGEANLTCTVLPVKSLTVKASSDSCLFLEITSGKGWRTMTNAA